MTPEETERNIATKKGTFEGDIKKTREDLLKYCELDTFGMVRI